MGGSEGGGGADGRSEAPAGSDEEEDEEGPAEVVGSSRAEISPLAPPPRTPGPAASVSRERFQDGTDWNRPVGVPPGVRGVVGGGAEEEEEASATLRARGASAGPTVSIAGRPDEPGDVASLAASPSASAREGFPHTAPIFAPANERATAATGRGARESGVGFNNATRKRRESRVVSGRTTSNRRRGSGTPTRAQTTRNLFRLYGEARLRRRRTFERRSTARAALPPARATTARRPHPRRRSSRTQRAGTGDL
jgi:hypothetical protein